MPQAPGGTPLCDVPSRTRLPPCCLARLRRDHAKRPQGGQCDMSKDIKGVLGTKLGMTQVFSDDGKIVPVTVVEAGPCVVTAGRTPDAGGYSAVPLGYGGIRPPPGPQPGGRPLPHARGAPPPDPA